MGMNEADHSHETLLTLSILDAITQLGLCSLIEIVEFSRYSNF